MLGGSCLVGAVDLEKLALAYELSGAAIAEVVRHATLQAAGAAISEARLREAIEVVQA
jgi:hypothetical protein